MSSSLPIQIAETIQTASINRAPSPTHDLNPSTAASSKQPVQVSHSHYPDPVSPTFPNRSPRSDRSKRSSSIPYDVIRPLPRRSTLPPLPDLRFEQSYLASLRGVEGWRGVVYVTVRDQVFLPLLQGTLWTLAISGWRRWNRTAQFSGASVGSRIRRWWWRVNNWEIPSKKVNRTGLRDQKIASEAREYFVGQFGSAGGD